MPVRVLIVDDNDEFRRQLTLNLDIRDDITVVGEAADGAHAIERVTALEPDIILMDVEMPGMDGLECTRQLTAVNPQLDIILLTIHDEHDLRTLAQRAMARAYVLKESTIDELLETIRSVSSSRRERAARTPYRAGPHGGIK